jgi:TonB family protein
VTVALFILQLGLIWTFAERGRKAPMPPAPEFTVHLAARPAEQDQLATALFAEDPTLFQAPRRRGFSSRAWMETSSPEYHAAETPAPDVWLSLNGSSWKPKSLAASKPVEEPLKLVAPTTTEFEPAAIFLAPEPPPASSALRITGALARRRIAAPAPQLPAQPSAQLLSNTVVQVAVDAAGQVTSARLLGNSGSLSADALALTTARGFRFEPATAPGDPLTWGKAIFSWQTVELTSAPGR